MFRSHVFCEIYYEISFFIYFIVFLHVSMKSQTLNLFMTEVPII